MSIKFPTLCLVILLYPLSHIFSQEVRYHRLLITVSDPIVIERCVDDINPEKDSYVKETLDKYGRTSNIELFDSGKYLSRAMIYSFVKYEYTDTSIIEILCESDSTPSQSEQAAYFGNRIEYVLKNKKVVKIYDYFNDTLLNDGKTYLLNNNKKPTVEYFYYAGCRPNMDYWLEKYFQENKEIILMDDNRQ